MPTFFKNKFIKCLRGFIVCFWQRSQSRVTETTPSLIPCLQSWGCFTSSWGPLRSCGVPVPYRPICSTESSLSSDFCSQQNQTQVTAHTLLPRGSSGHFSAFLASSKSEMPAAWPLCFLPCQLKRAKVLSSPTPSTSRQQLCVDVHKLSAASCYLWPRGLPREHRQLTRNPHPSRISVYSEGARHPSMVRPWGSQLAMPAAWEQGLSTPCSLALHCPLQSAPGNQPLRPPQDSDHPPWIVISR
jgi:hypothetical protein